jgi:hypothetical protein
MTYKVSSGGRRLPCRPRALPLIGLLLVHTACYSYKPVNTSPAVSGSSSGTAAAVEPTEENPELKQGDRIRVHLSEPGDYELMDVVPRNVTLRRVVSVGKTAGIAVLIAGAVAALGVVFGTSGGESGGTQPPVQPQ